MTGPEIALLIPCHNAGKYLPRLMETVRGQSAAFAEIICYDDASTDDTSVVAQQFSDRVLTATENRGPAYARNQLWRATRREWVHFHDADDLLEPEFVAQMSSRLHGDIDVVICSADWRFEDTRALEMRWTYSERELRRAPVDYLLTHPVGGINGVYRRSALENIGGYDERLKVWEDADLHVRLAAAGSRFAVIEQPLVTALRRRDSLSAPLLRNWQNRLTALRRYVDILPHSATPAIIAELENAARALLRYGDPSGARSALDLARSLGGDVPTTNHPLVKLCKRTLGRMAALRLQTLARRG